MPKPRKQREFRYDVCLSFAGEDRRYVAGVAQALEERGIRVFYDDYEEAALWGKDLYAHLDHIYREAARYCVLFVSKHYKKKVWTNHERESAQARSIEENKEYILPARFDNTKIPGLRSTVGFINLSKRTPLDVANLIAQKLPPRQRSDYFPPVPDRLFSAMRVRGAKKQKLVHDHAWQFVEILRRMTKEERRVVFTILLEGCPAELPENVHINIDLLRRYTDISVSRIKRLLV